jgi:hypothetical protein
MILVLLNGFEREVRKFQEVSNTFYVATRKEVNAQFQWIEEGSGTKVSHSIPLQRF